jgi:hypothetical protein
VGSPEKTGPAESLTEKQRDGISPNDKNKYIKREVNEIADLWIRGDYRAATERFRADAALWQRNSMHGPEFVSALGHIFPSLQIETTVDGHQIFSLVGKWDKRRVLLDDTRSIPDSIPNSDSRFARYGAIPDLFTAAEQLANNKRQPTSDEQVMIDAYKKRNHLGKEGKLTQDDYVIALASQGKDNDLRLARSLKEQHSVDERRARAHVQEVYNGAPIQKGDNSWELYVRRVAPPGYFGDEEIRKVAQKLENLNGKVLVVGTQPRTQSNLDAKRTLALVREFENMHWTWDGNHWIHDRGK